MGTFYPASNHIALQKWQPYLKQNSRELVDSRIKLLKALCDSESQEHIDCYINRVFAQPDTALRQFFKIDFRSIAEMTRPSSLEDIVRAKPKLDVPGLMKKYDLAKLEIDPIFIRPENFLFHSGMTHVPGAKKILKKRCIIDGGAYRGESAAVFRKNYPNCPVHAFEPSSKNFKVLEWMTKNTKYGVNVVPVNMGIGASSFRATTTGEGHGTHLVKDVSGQLAITSLDDYAQDQKLKVGCIKLDVEGVEKAVIEGAERIIREQTPILLISIYHTPEDFLDICPMIHDWDLGYTFKVRHLHPQLSSFFGEFMLIGIPEH